MPSASAAQHRWIEAIRHNPAELARTGMSQRQVDEWSHADKGSPWKHRDAGGGIAETAPDPYDYTDRYNTALTPDEEDAYRAWGRTQAAARQDGRDPSQDTYDYDMRGFWKSGASFGGNGHAADTYKKPNHTTYSTMSKYAEPDKPAGKWDQDKDGRWSFAPSTWNLTVTPPEDMQRYFDQQEPGSTLMLPQRRDIGGSVDPSTQGTGIGGSAPTAANENPLVQGMTQRYASMPTEKLAEMAVMLGGTQQGGVIQRLLMQRRMMPQGAQEAQAAAQQPTMLSQARGGLIPHRADGGSAVPWWTRQEARGAEASTTGGFLNGATAGRADNVQTSAPGGSYVLPADVIAGLGEGNSLAGARAMDMILNSHPYGIASSHHGPERGPPRPPSPYGQAAGGVHSGSEMTPVALSHGEYVVSPAQITAIGGGDIKAGHRILDSFVLQRRAHDIKTLTKLPGPVGARKPKKAIDPPKMKVAA